MDFSSSSWSDSSLCSDLSLSDELSDAAGSARGECDVGIVLCPREHELQAVLDALQPLLEAFEGGRVVQVAESAAKLQLPAADLQLPAADLQLPVADVHDANRFTPAVAMQFFQHEDLAPSVSRLQETLQSPPWRFHHRVELWNARGQLPSQVAETRFYQTATGLPLVALGSVHTGRPLLRFTVFTRRLGAMLEFYRILTGSEADHLRAHFCLFTLGCAARAPLPQPVPEHLTAIEVQLAIKTATQLQPVPCSRTLLKLRPSYAQLCAVLTSPPQRLDNNMLLIRDPEGNALLVTAPPVSIPPQVTAATAVQSWNGAAVSETATV